MGDILIETQIDELSKLVTQRKRVKVSEAAKILKTTESRIEEWVRILEDHGFVKLVYPALGEPEIILNGSENSTGKCGKFEKKSSDSDKSKSKSNLGFLKKIHR